MRSTKDVHKTVVSGLELSTDNNTLPSSDTLVNSQQTYSQTEL